MEIILAKTWAILLAVWHWLTFGVENEQAMIIISLAWGYLGLRAKPVLAFLVFVVRAFKDSLLSDTEAAGLLWNLAAVLYGWLPSVHKPAILKYAPEHWHPVILYGREPTFELVAVPKEQLEAVKRLLILEAAKIIETGGA